MHDPSELGVTRPAIDLLGVLVSLAPSELSGFRDQLRALLAHDDEDVRVHSARALFVTLKEANAHTAALDCLTHDPSAKVRRVAAFGVAATSTSQTRDIDTRVLVQTVLQSGESPRVRGAAYEALLILYHRTDFPPVKREIDLDRDVDWQWIRELSHGPAS